MPHKDPEAARTYARERARKLRADPAYRLKCNARYMQRLHERLKEDPEFRAARNAAHRAQHASNRPHKIAVQRKRYVRLRADFEVWRDGLLCQQCSSAENIQFHH